MFLNAPVTTNLFSIQFTDLKDKPGIRSYWRITAFFLNCLGMVTTVKTKDDSYLYLDSRSLEKWKKTHANLATQTEDTVEFINTVCSNALKNEAANIFEQVNKSGVFDVVLLKRGIELHKFAAIRLGKHELADACDKLMDWIDAKKLNRKLAERLQKNDTHLNKLAGVADVRWLKEVIAEVLSKKISPLNLGVLSKSQKELSKEEQAEIDNLRPLGGWGIGFVDVCIKYYQQIAAIEVELQKLERAERLNEALLRLDADLLAGEFESARKIIESLNKNPALNHVQKEYLADREKALPDLEKVVAKEKETAVALEARFAELSLGKKIEAAAKKYELDDNSPLLKKIKTEYEAVLKLLGGSYSDLVAAPDLAAAYPKHVTILKKFDSESLKKIGREICLRLLYPLLFLRLKFHKNLDLICEAAQYEKRGERFITKSEATIAEKNQYRSAVAELETAQTKIKDIFPHEAERLGKRIKEIKTKIT